MSRHVLPVVLFLLACTGIVAVDQRNAEREAKLRVLLERCSETQSLKASAAELRELADALREWANELERDR